MKSKKVFVVMFNDDENHDHAPVAVFSRKEKAEAWLAESEDYNQFEEVRDQFEIHEFDLDKGGNGDVVLFDFVHGEVAAEPVDTKEGGR